MLVVTPCPRPREGPLGPHSHQFPKENPCKYSLDIWNHLNWGWGPLGERQELLSQCASPTQHVLGKKVDNLPNGSPIFLDLVHTKIVIFRRRDPNTTRATKIYDNLTRLSHLIVHRMHPIWWGGIVYRNNNRLCKIKFCTIDPFIHPNNLYYGYEILFNGKKKKKKKKSNIIGKKLM